MGLFALNSQTVNAASPIMPAPIIAIPEGAGSKENPYIMQKSVIKNSTEPVISYLSPLDSAHSLLTLVNNISEFVLMGGTSTTFG